MTRSELAHFITLVAKRYEGDVQGDWFGTGDREQIMFYMEIEFPNMLDAAMFANDVANELSVNSDIRQQNDRPVTSLYKPVVITVKRVMS